MCWSDGFVAPVGEREAYHGLFSGKKHVCGQNVQVVADLDGLLADVGEPVNGARHDAAAFFISGIAQRWADHYAAGGPGMIGDGGYQGTGPITPHKKPPRGELTARQKAYNYSVNRLRAAVERAIAHLKSWKILKTGYHRIMTKFPTCYVPLPPWGSSEPSHRVLNDPPGLGGGFGGAPAGGWLSAE